MRKAWRECRRVVPFSLILFSGTMFGCAFTDRHVTLTPPTTIPQTFSPSTPSANKKTISVARPQDLRPDPTTVGNIKNGYGMVTAQVRSNNDIPMWVTNSIIQGLEQAGYRVERVETVETALTPVAIDIAVSRAFTEHVAGFITVTGKGDIAAQIEVYRDGSRILRRMYAGKYEDRNFFVSTSADAYQVLLDAAMKDFLRKTLTDLVSALDRAFADAS